jgi:lysine 2,3-aminomutase
MSIVEHEQRLEDWFPPDRDGRFRRYVITEHGSQEPGKNGPSSDLYSQDEIHQLEALPAHLRVESRMPIKATDWYINLAARSEPLTQLIKATPDETADLSGSARPADHSAFSPMPGLVHMYPGIVRISVASTCSAHCRYCYQQEHLAKRPSSGLVQIGDVQRYIRTHNALAREQGDSATLIREALLSGGDPMVLSNRGLLRWWMRLAEAGISTIRIATKEFAFFPFRFDKSFFEALDAFHGTYADVRFVFVTHFSHPDEFLCKDNANQYCAHGDGLRWLAEAEKPIAELAKRTHFVALTNQTPIINGINDDPRALECLQREMSRHNIGNHYFFQCREILGYKKFAVPVERTLDLVTQSQRGLSGFVARGRLVMSTRVGKLEVIGRSHGSTEIAFRVIRAPRSYSGSLGAMVVARCNPEGLWVSDYRDRIVSDDMNILSGELVGDTL